MVSMKTACPSLDIIVASTTAVATTTTTVDVVATEKIYYRIVCAAVMLHKLIHNYEALKIKLKTFCLNYG